MEIYTGRRDMSEIILWKALYTILTKYIFFWLMLKTFKEKDLFLTESCFRHPLFDLRGTRKVEIRHTNFHFSSKEVTSKSRKGEVFDPTSVKKLSTFRPHVCLTTSQFNAKSWSYCLLISTFLDKREVEKWKVFWQLSGQKLQLFDFSR